MKRSSTGANVLGFLLLVVLAICPACGGDDDGGDRDEADAATLQPDAGEGEPDAGDGQPPENPLAFPPSDPAAEGAFKVGVIETSIDDHLSVDGESRPLRVLIWYPTGSEQKPEAFGGVQDAPVAEGGPFPLIAYSHGLGAYASCSTFQVTHLVSHGFVVVAPDHPKSTLQDCGMNFCADKPDNLPDSHANRPSEIHAAVDLVLAESAREGALLQGAVDGERLGVMGHSFGGGTTVRLLAEENNRFLAGIPMAPGLAGGDEPSRVAAPVLFISGEKDSIVAYTNVTEMYATIPESTERLFLTFPNADHYAFIDLCVTGCTGEGALPVGLGHELINTYGTAFLQVHVAGQTAFAGYLEPDGDIAGAEARLVQGSLP